MFISLSILIAALILAAAALAAWLFHRYRRRYDSLSRRMPSSGHDHDINRIAMTDALTQLPNRRALKQHLEAGIRRSARLQSSLALAFIDLDDFKPVNDNYGHHIGDEALKIVADRLNTAVRRCDLVGRIGGDEFLALIEDIKSNQDIVAIIERIIEALREPFYIQQHELHLSASIGIAIYPRDGDIDRLMIAADAAMYHAKNAGKSQFRFYDKEMGLASDRLLELQRDLRNAIERNEFELYYQPKIDSKSYSLAGVEALLRWQHPVKGWIAPDVFIPAAERFGLMGQINHWIVEESCRTLHRMRSMGVHLQISINLAVQQLRNPAMVAEVLAVLQRFDLPHSCLMFEVKEAIALNHPEQFGARLQELAAAGIDVAMDNFGAGQTALAGVQRAGISQLKLDLALTCRVAEDEKSREIIDALIRLAHALELTVVAAGVETETQSRILAALDCDQMQGYLFGRPVPNERLPQLIRQIAALQL